MKKNLGLVLLAIIAIVLVKIMKDFEAAEGSRVAEFQARARSAAADRIKDPRDGIVKTVDDAIADAAEEIKGA